MRAATLALAVAVLLAPAPARAAPSLQLGLTDSVFQTDALTRAPWLERSASSGADLVLLHVRWDGVAPASPRAGFDAADPADSQYNWAQIDGAVRDAAAHGLTPVLAVEHAPSWAEGPGRRGDAEPSTWRPDARAFGLFARAIATRYSGAFTPAAAAALPRVRIWEAWAEPNSPLQLTPQWLLRDGRPEPESPHIYRALLNAFYASVKSVTPDAVVISAGTAPFGDPPGGARMAPATFVRSLLCVTPPPLRPLPCPEPAHFDVLAHHPYSASGPYAHARAPNDVSVPDLARLTAPLRLAENTGRALGSHRHALWVTEFSWDSDPPDPGGVPAARHARWLEQALFLLWRQGAAAIVWFQVRDEAPVPDYASTFQSGLYQRDGRAKPAQQAFAFPFVLERVRSHSLRAWGRAPLAGRLSIERRARHRWVGVRALPVGAHQVFSLELRAHGPVTMRARIEARASLPFAQR